MIREPDKNLKEGLSKAGISYRHVCLKLKLCYATWASWINGYSVMPEDIKRQVVGMIQDTMQKKAE